MSKADILTYLENCYKQISVLSQRKLEGEKEVEEELFNLHEHTILMNDRLSIFASGFFRNKTVFLPDGCIEMSADKKSESRKHRKNEEKKSQIITINDLRNMLPAEFLKIFIDAFDWYLGLVFMQEIYDDGIRNKKGKVTL